MVIVLNQMVDIRVPGRVYEPRILGRIPRERRMIIWKANLRKAILMKGRTECQYKNQKVCGGNSSSHFWVGNRTSVKIISLQ